MSAPTYLRGLWPLFILAKIGEEGCKGHFLPDLICPPTVQKLREVYGAVMQATNPTAAAGLATTSDEELSVWVKVLKADLLGNSEFTPAFLFDGGVVLTGLAQLVSLPLFERQDVFLHACHVRGMEHMPKAVHA